MKALPPAPPQLQLAILQEGALVVIDPEARKEALRALAEILLIAAEPAAVRGQADAEGEDDETP